MPLRPSRRTFLLSASLLLVRNRFSIAQDVSAEPVIDIHQHTNYSGRTDDELILHQKRMGVTTTILLPAGKYVERETTHMGKSNGLAVQAGGNESVVKLSKAHPGEYVYFCNEVPDLEGARAEMEKYLKTGALGIGEQKFNIEVDSREMQVVMGLAQEYDVPVLMHFQYAMYNEGYDRFWKVLEKYPKVKFIGHAQTFWANIDRDYSAPQQLYPKTKVTPGGLTDIYLSDYPNMYGDLSAGSGLNALQRDEGHAREFLARHQDKLMYGSDCNDKAGRPPVCTGAICLDTLRRIAPSKEIERKLLYLNAKKMFRL